MPGYEACLSCGTFHSLAAPPPESIYTPDYWTHERGHSTIEEQVYNTDGHLEGGVSKNDYLLSLIEVEDKSRALEIGCAPGSFLGRLKRDAAFFWVDGIDVSEGWRDAIGEAAGLGKWDDWAYHAGFFPECMNDWVNRATGLFSLIVASDVFEHTHEPERFLRECARILRPDGQLLIMTPLVGFGEIPERMWHPVEHVYLHSLGNTIALLADAGFERFKVNRWTPGHETISARKSDNAPVMEWQLVNQYPGPSEPASYVLDDIDYDSDGETCF